MVFQEKEGFSFDAHAKEGRKMLKGKCLPILAYQKPRGEDNYPIQNMQRSKSLSQF